MTNKVDEFARDLRIEDVLKTPLGRCKVALFCAACELSAHFPRSSQAVATVERYGRMADPKLSSVAIEEAISRVRSVDDRSWLITEWADEGMRAALNPHGLVLALLMVMPSDTNVQAAKEYVDAVAARVGVEAETTYDLSGWLARSSSTEKAAMTDAMLSQLSKLGPLSRTIVREARRMRVYQADDVGGMASLFAEARARIEAAVREVLERAEVLGLARRPLEELREYVHEDRFRLAVLGEFKRGKSTLVNAIIERPAFAPAETLPSTSALIELRYGATERYWHRSSAPDGQFVEGTKAAFREDAGSASKRWTAGAGADPEGAAESIRRWRVEVPSKFLERSGIDLIDTPGLGEDPARDWVAKREAHRADAALVVLNARQLASLQELSLVEEMASKLQSLIVVVNHADAITQTERGNLRRHVVDRLRSRGLQVADDRVVFVSAQRAEQAIREDRADSWRVEVEALVDLAWRHLLRGRGPMKARVIADRIDRVVTEAKATARRRLEIREAQLASLTHLEDQAAATARAERDGQEALRMALLGLGRRGAQAGEDLCSAFDKELPSLLVGMQSTKDRWTSEHNPVTSPKKHIEEIGAQAQAAVTREVEKWARSQTEPGAAWLIGQSLDTSLREVNSVLLPLHRFLGSVLGVDPHLAADAVLEAFDLPPGDNPGTGSVVGSAVLAGAVAVVVGYVIADVILFYVLGVIAGFLNPILLAAALVVAAAAFVFKGPDFIRSWVRGKVANAVGEAIQKPDNLVKIHAGLKAAVEKVFDRVGATMERTAKDLIHEARYQNEKAVKELREKKQQLGDPTVLALEVRRLRDAEQAVQKALDDLAALGAQIREDLGDDEGPKALAAGA